MCLSLSRYFRDLFCDVKDLSNFFQQLRVDHWDWASSTKKSYVGLTIPLTKVSDYPSVSTDSPCVLSCSQQALFSHD